MKQIANMKQYAEVKANCINLYSYNVSLMGSDSQAGRGHWTVNAASTQSFLIRWLKSLGTFIE